MAEFDGLEQGLSIGQGGNQIYNTSGNIAFLGNILRQQQAQRQHEQQVLANDLSQVKIDGLRDPDKPEFFNRYQELKNTASKIPYERDSWKRAQLKADVDRRILELQDYAAKSKTYGKNYDEFGNKLLDNRFRDQFTDDAVSRYQQAKSAPMNDPRFIQDFTSLGRQVDGEAINKMISGVEGQLLKKSQWGTPIQTASSQGNKSGVMFYNKREVDPKEQLFAYANLYDTDRDFRKFITDQYQDVFDSNPQQAKALALKDYADKRRAQGTLSETTAPQFRQDWRPRVTVNVNGDNASTHRQKVIAGLMNNDKNYLTEAQTYLPQGSKVEFKTSVQKDGHSKGGYNLVRVTIPERINADGTITEGLTEDISLSKGDPTNRLNSILNQYSGEKVSPSKLNTEGGKPRGSDIRIPKVEKVPLAKPSKKTIKRTDVEDRAKAAGYSVKEYTKLLKANGVTIE